ncbi:MAG: restriction endonuclease subunit S [Verrucomicrobiota bacterium]
MSVALTIKPLKRLTEINREVLPESTPEDFEIEYVDISSVSGMGRILGTETLLFGKAPSRARRLVRNGDTIISTVRTYLRAITSIQSPPPNLVVSTGFATLTPGPEIDGGYFAYFAQTEHFIHEVVSRSTGVSYPAITPSELGNIQISYPPLATQRRIAAYLDRETRQIDALVASKEELLGLLAEKRASLISHAVTRGLNPKAKLKPSGIPWLGEIPGHWSVAQVGHRYHVDLGKMLDAKKISGDYLKPYLRNQDVQWSGINTAELPQMDIKPGEESRFALLPGDLLVCEGGECGRCSIWTETQECYYQKALHRLRPRTARDHSRFFRFLMEVAVTTGVFASDSNANTIGHLPAEKFRNYRMVFPPVEEQQKIADYLFEQEAYFKSLRLNIQTSIALLREKRGSLIAAAVTGELAVV